MPTTVMWFRRDLRLGDHPALLAAAEQGDVVPLFVLDDALWTPAGVPRQQFLLQSLRALDTDLREHGPGLVVRRGRPEEVVAAVVEEAGACAVHISEDFGPYGHARDDRVRDALGEDVPLVATGSPYAVSPGRVTTQQGETYKVFTPFSRAWAEHGWRAPAESDPSQVTWRSVRSEDLPKEPQGDADLPEAGEEAALQRWRDFLDEREHYDDERDQLGKQSTSGMSPYLRWGAIHPRTLLADLGPDDASLRSEIAWREFYAAALWAWPHAAREYLKPEYARMPYVTGNKRKARFEAWCEGRTGFPVVDAAMRELLATGLMHNRARMVVASFLVKDLKIEWTWGARHFMRHLVDGDLASNQLNWQWVGGSGLDAAPYFRIFNPTKQGEKFDPDGHYVRRWVPELADVEGRAVHTPWTLSTGVPEGYPEPIVDHKAERESALEAYQELRTPR
ncbi:DNA photolyase family protein [Nocardioides panacisoli]|uniref:cryptochrome/photolyase family protein n=1 Tax=Nocardioides panacisoli TaxID=627624 RepID=UPI001C639D95|nr:deoxyribodipyrimidine photo-lyase [Nocardioides panacisoli]QYJ02551.1 DNA photolyase family protein [Nocardioides panacisoli]